jgi:hypothetical protein
MRRIFLSIVKLLANLTQIAIVFSHLERSHNIAGLLLEQRKANEERYKRRDIFSTAPATMPAILYA